MWPSLSSFLRLFTVVLVGHVLFGCDGEEGTGDRAAGGGAVGGGDDRRKSADEANLPGDGPYWRVDAGGERIEGTIVFVEESDEDLVFQLVNREAVNLILVVPSRGGDERFVRDVFFREGRGQTCTPVYSDPPFRVRLQSSESGWWMGDYEGVLGCPDYSELPVSGTFQVRKPADDEMVE